MNDRAWYEDVPLLRLLRETRDAYREAIGRALADAGCDDLPRNAVVVLMSLDHTTPAPAFSPQASVVASLGLSKQAASQLIDTLVLREYLERRIDPDDRRRMGVRLTGRGRTAATAIPPAIDAIEADLARLSSSGAAASAGFRRGRLRRCTDISTPLTSQRYRRSSPVRQP